jgi:hypothetical protein
MRWFVQDVMPKRITDDKSDLSWPFSHGEMSHEIRSTNPPASCMGHRGPDPLRRPDRAPSQTLVHGGGAESASSDPDAAEDHASGGAPGATEPRRPGDVVEKGTRPYCSVPATSDNTDTFPSWLISGSGLLCFYRK